MKESAAARGSGGSSGRCETISFVIPVDKIVHTYIHTLV